MKFILLFVLFIGANFASFADLSLEGHYQGKNLFVQNPDDEDDFGFCVTSVTVNGDPVSDRIESSAFEIDFTEFNVKVGDPVFIVLIHGLGCKPKVLNPEVLKPKSSFEIVSISCEPDGNMSWVTKNESGKLAFVIEQFRWIQLFCIRTDTNSSAFCLSCMSSLNATNTYYTQSYCLNTMQTQCGGFTFKSSLLLQRITS